MINKKSLIFCIVTAFIVVVIGSITAWTVINRSNSNHTSGVDTVEVESTDNNIIGALQNQTGEQSDSTGESKVKDLCARYIANTTGYDITGYTGEGKYVSFSGLANAEPYWFVTIDLKNGNKYGLSVKIQNTMPVVTNLYVMGDDNRYNQRLVLTKEMENYLDDFGKKIDDYTNQYTGAIDYSDEYSEYSKYFGIIYSGLEDYISYDKVKSSGLAEFLGISDDNAQDTYSKDELSEMLDNAIEEKDQEMEDMQDSFDSLDDSISSLTNEMTDKLNDYIKTRSEEFVNNKSYDSYVDAAVKAFKTQYGENIDSSKICAKAYLDVMVNKQKGIVVKLLYNAQTYWMVLNNETKDIMRISTDEDIINGVEFSQVF